MHLIRRIYENAMEDDLMGEAAKMAYFFFLSLFPLVVILLTLTQQIGGAEVFSRLSDAVRPTVPDYAWTFVDDLIREVSSRGEPELLSASLVVALWAASSGVASLTRGLNAMYNVKDPRSWVKRRLLALGILLASVVLVVISAATFIPLRRELFTDDLWSAWPYLRWIGSFLLLTAAAWLAYRFLPARSARIGGVPAVVGAAVASILWLLISTGFSMYIANVARYGRLYGAVGAVIVLLIWFYLSALVLLIGGEFAATMAAERRRREVA
jgi:membrane protein